MSVIFECEPAVSKPRPPEGWLSLLAAGDDAAAVELLPLNGLKAGLTSGELELAFDHGEIVAAWLGGRSAKDKNEQ